ncbi:MAG: helix-turn-helix domain-containing protein [Chloroflexi bacterium]|nr:helix-turn-helix domain-containing protein [Chloroflexota bacterium]
MCDAVLRAQNHYFVLKWKRSGSASVVAGAITQLRMAQSSFSRGEIPLLAVPYMGEAAQELCARADLAWLDLSGNARIVVPGIFYQNLGNPSLFRRPGRPQTAFGPRGSQVARHLLIEPAGTLKQREIASGAGLSEGHVSRIVRKLLEAGLVERDEDGVRVIDRGALLDAWREDYRFDRHHVIRGHISTRDGESLTRSIADALDRAGSPYAATALPAAWLWTRYAGFRLSTVYLASPPSATARRDLGFREEARGANTWLVVPNDDGVFDGAEPVDGIRCVHPVQAYLDLKDHPERAAEAAAELRSRLLLRGNGDL